VRVVVLRATGPSFCAGADVHWMRRMVGYTLEENIADAATMARMLRAIRECPKPVIARVHGAAYGGGVGLVAACDMAVASEDAVFCLSEVKLGIVPAVISPFVVEKIGAAAMRRYALTAERFDALEARRLGLVSEVARTAETLDNRVSTVIGHILANGPQALAACKQILSAVGGRDWDATVELTTRCIAERRVSPEGQEGLKAFLEKRPPSWAQESE
jgi:methylglutaconyl-CoA hydratase